jgi:Flp pilus assembly pilin Flp
MESSKSPSSLRPIARRRIRSLGQGMTEYIIIVALIAIAAIGVVTLFGDQIRNLFTSSEPARDDRREERRDDRLDGRGETRNIRRGEVRRERRADDDRAIRPAERRDDKRRDEERRGR